MIRHRLTSRFGIVACRKSLWGASHCQLIQQCALLSSDSTSPNQVSRFSCSPSPMLHQQNYTNGIVGQILAFSNSTTFRSVSSSTEDGKNDSLPKVTLTEESDSEADLSDSDSETTEAESWSSQSKKLPPNWPPNSDEIKEISDGDPELEKKVEFILMEHELLRQEGVRVPSHVVKKYWPELLNLKSKRQRIKFFSYLWKTEMKSVAAERKKSEKRLKRQEEFDQLPRPSLEEDECRMTYGLCRNTIFLRLYDSKVVTTQFHRVISEMVLGTPLVIDCGYDDEMVFQEAKNCAAQLEYLLTDNRVHPQPFNLTFCNANPNSATLRQLVKRIPILYNDEYALDIRRASYLDIFPREKLVYLSPHAREEMETFDDDEIYIIGAIVDKSDPRPFSIAKAKREGLRVKRLPLDSRMDWGIGSKSLTLNQLVNIMLEIRATRDWDKAFRFIPKRKLIGGRTECPPRVLTDYASMVRRRERREFHLDVKDEHLVSSRRGGIRSQANNDQYFDDKMKRNQRFQGKQSEFGESKNSVKTIMSDY